jgi:hypothetical protein
LYIKDSGLTLAITTLLPAALSAAFLGLAVSAWTNSALQATVASAIYLLAQALLSGFLYPVSTAGFGPARLVASAFPLTFAGATVRTSILGAEPSWGDVATPLFAMTVVYAVLAWVALDARLRRL